jgi:hypothetical protein
MPRRDFATPGDILPHGVLKPPVRISLFFGRPGPRLQWLDAMVQGSGTIKKPAISPRLTTIDPATIDLASPRLVCWDNRE